MNYLNITKYIYLGIGIIMIYMSISTWNDQTEVPWLYLILSGLGFFTFFFRSKFGKKFEERNNPNNPNNT